MCLTIQDSLLTYRNKSIIVFACIIDSQSGMAGHQSFSIIWRIFLKYIDPNIFMSLATCILKKLPENFLRSTHPPSSLPAPPSVLITGVLSVRSYCTNQVDFSSVVHKRGTCFLQLLFRNIVLSLRFCI